MVGIIAAIIIGSLVLFVIGFILIKGPSYEKASQIKIENIKEREEAERKLKIENEKMIKQQKIEREALYGPPTREIGGYCGLIKIQVYDEKEVIFFGDREVKYNMILSYALSDNSQTITQGGNMQAKTSTGSMIGRGVAGGLLLGGVGALAGAATAKKSIQKEESHTFTNHSYKVHIDIASPTDPLITIDCGSNEGYARNITATLNYIIHKLTTK